MAKRGAADRRSFVDGWWRRLGLPLEELERLLSADARRLTRLAGVLELAGEVHGERAPRWLQSPEPALGGILPKTLLRDPANGPALVEQALLNARNGPLR